MDRRGFLAGVGTLGAAAAGGVALVDLHAGAKRADNLAKAAGAYGAASSNPFTRKAGSAVDGVTIGYLPDSDLLWECEAKGWDWSSFATTMRWTRWDPSQSRYFARDVNVALGAPQIAQSCPQPGMLASLEVVAFFAIDAAPQVATFDAWKYAVDARSKRASGTSPLRFAASMPDQVALQVNYALDPAALAPNTSASGMVYLPLGGREGLGIGLYAIAAPSRFAGAAPNFADHLFTGSLQTPLMRGNRSAPDFDYTVLAIRPAKA